MIGECNQLDVYFVFEDKALWLCSLHKLAECSPFYLLLANWHASHFLIPTATKGPSFCLFCSSVLCQDQLHSYSWAVMRNTESQAPLQAYQTKNLCLINISRWFLCILNFERHWSTVLLYPEICFPELQCPQYLLSLPTSIFLNMVTLSAFSHLDHSIIWLQLHWHVETCSDSFLAWLWLAFKSDLATPD